MKTQHFLKNYGVAAVAIVVAVSTMSFRMAENRRVSYWFEVERINPSLGDTEANLRITNVSTTPPPSGSDPFGCAQANSGNVCQTNLEIGTTDPNTLADKTIAEARSMTGAGSPGYAKEPQP